MFQTSDFKNFFFSSILPILVGLVVIYTYFSPILKGKVIEQDDIMMGYAKSHQVNEYREKTGKEAFWTQAMFSGMPTFQLSIQYPNNWLGSIQQFFGYIFGQTSWLYIFPLMLIGFFIMARSFDVSPWLSLFGALAFAFSAFFIISFAAGHVSKVRTAAYIPVIAMGIILTYRGWWKSGFVATALGIGLSILSNHFQITFYTLLIILCIGIVYLINYIREKQVSLFLKRTLLLFVAGFIGAAPNIGNLWTTMSYTKETIRGGNTQLQETKDSDLTGDKGLSWQYAMSWSYGKAETLNLFIPFFTGGGAKETYEGTETFERLTTIMQQQGMNPSQAEKTANQYAGSILYWGDQSLVNGAYYVGAGMVFLFVLGLLLIKGPTKTWIVAGSVLSVLMAWGMNFEFFNRILFEYLPLYNKFRVPSMTLVILFFLIPLTAVLGLKEIMDKSYSKEHLKKKLLLSFYITGGLALLIALIGSSLFDLSSPRDQQFIQQGFSEDLLINDRAALLRSSAFKSLLFVTITFGLVWLFITNKIKKPVFTISLLVVLLIDLIPYNLDQLGKDEFVTQKSLKSGFTATPADQTILNDPDPHFRVWNSTASLTSDSYTSYYHKSVAGYHGAKLARYQDLIENQLSKNNMACFNMLNTKWVIVKNNQGGRQAQMNNRACGNAWFVNQIKWVDSPAEEMAAMDNFDPMNTVIIDKTFTDYVGKINSSDSGVVNTIELTNYDPKHLQYQATVSSPEALAVFSEIYYDAPGQQWHAYIDGKEVEHIRVNYLLRALKIPQGKHQIEFKFIPKTYIMGEKIDLFASILLFGTIIVLIFLGSRNYFKKSGTKL